MAILDQYGNVVPSSRGAIPYDLSDPMAVAVWSRALAAEIARPGMFDGPALVDSTGRSATGPFRNAQPNRFAGIILDGKLLGPED